MEIVIFANGEITNADFARNVAKSADFIICCDGGGNHAADIGIVPNMLLGDLDSINSAVLMQFEMQGVAVKRFSAEKDFTDLELAIEHAICQNPDKITILGGFGGRADHFLGNIHALITAAKAGVEAVLLDDGIKACVICSCTEIKQTNYNNISLIPLTTQVCGVTTCGLQYPLNGETLKIGSARGVSNKFAAPTATIGFTSGLLLIICS